METLLHSSFLTGSLVLELLEVLSCCQECSVLNEVITKDELNEMGWMKMIPREQRVCDDIFVHNNCLKIKPWKLILWTIDLYWILLEALYYCMNSFSWDFKWYSVCDRWLGTVISLTLYLCHHTTKIVRWVVPVNFFPQSVFF